MASRPRLNAVLWSAQGLLAGLYGVAAFFETTQSYAVLNRQMAWTSHVSPRFVQAIAACHALGAIGLILPMLTRVRPNLTVATAMCLAILQLLAIGMHISIGEFFTLPLNLALLALALFVFWGRSR